MAQPTLKRRYFDGDSKRIPGLEESEETRERRAVSRVALVWRICLRRNPREFHRVYSQPAPRRLSIAFPATKVKERIGWKPAGQEGVTPGRSIKCSDAVQAKSNGNS